jgi:DNA repair exonuclease SbcCD ATPase subunit
MTENQLVLRIPSKNLRKVMAELGEYGNVEHRTLRAMDVTAEFTDIESRIKALEETQKQLLELLSKSRNVQEALQVRQALDNITTQLEVLKGRMRQLSNQISFSTLTVNLYERGPHTPVPSSNDPFPWVNDLGVESTEWK